MRLSHLAISSLMASSLLASCQTYDFGSREPYVAPAPSGIEGEWVDTRGINTALFGNGTFTSVDAKTGQTMARGSYNYRDQQNVNLAFTSLIRNTTVNAACLVVTPTQLNCTTSTGAKFTLIRKAVAPTTASGTQQPVQQVPTVSSEDAVLIGKV